MSATRGWLQVTRPLRASSVHAPPLTSSTYTGPCDAALRPWQRLRRMPLGWCKV